MPVTVLVVEDNELNQELARDLLEHEGHRVLIARDAAAMRAALAVTRPDLVLLDILLPGTDGVSLLRELRAAGYESVPIIAVTAHALDGDVARFRAAGFDDVLTKPLDTRTFVSDVLRHVEARRHRGRPEGS